MKRSHEPDDENLDLAARAESNTPEVALQAFKFTELDDEEDRDDAVMRCSLPPHPEVLYFRSYEDHEAHYHSAHSNRCLECRKNFPTAHLRDIHIEECHDSFVAVKRDKGERTYSCFVEGCDRKCRTPQKRRMHLIDKHLYPKHYFFTVTRDGIDGHHSMLIDSRHHRRHRSSQTAETRLSRRWALITENGGDETTGQQARPDGGVDGENKGQAPVTPSAAPNIDPNMEALTGSMSALQFVPPSVRFGRGGRRVGFSRR